MNEKNITFNDLDILLLVNILIKNFFFIALITILAAVASVLIALNIPNIYKSTIILAPTNQSSSASQGFSRSSQISSLTGINIPIEIDSKTAEAQERIKSLDFFINEFLPYIKPENLAATKGWNREDDAILYDNSIYDSINKNWVRKNSWPLNKTQPSNQELYKFYEKNLQIDEDDDTGFIKISFRSHSANLAKLWLDLITSNINNSMREIDKKSAQESINFLQVNRENTNLQYMQETFSRLMESQVQTLMLASSNESYVFKIISPAYPPELKDSPSRALICIVGTFIGFMLSCLYFIVLTLRQKAL